MSVGCHMEFKVMVMTDESNLIFQSHKISIQFILFNIIRKLW